MPASRFILREIMGLGMRIAMKIAYDGRAFFGHQRQPDARTVEGECLSALRAAKLILDPEEAFFRSASRTDRGVSAIGNVIAFNTPFPPDAVVGAFNDRARDVWAWAVSSVPASFHPRHALERWYRYHLFSDLPISSFRSAAALFVGKHRFDSFTSDPAPGPLTINRIDVTREAGTTLFDIRARSFRRAMIRRIVAAALGSARGDIGRSEIRAALRGTRRDFGMVSPEPLFLMDVQYPFAMEVLLKPKVRDEWGSMERETELRVRFVRALREAARGAR